jgi:hypothetical protein
MQRACAQSLSLLPQRNAQEDGRLGAAAAWEHRTDARIQANATSARFEALRAERAAGIDARRAALAAKLKAEDDALKAELLAAQQTPAQRRAEMAARARQLAERREAERRALADELLEAAFRENCDPLRERHSRTIAHRTQQEWARQVEERRVARELDAEHQRAEDTARAAAGASLPGSMVPADPEQRREEAARRAKAAADEVKASLDAQVGGGGELPGWVWLLGQI